MFTETTTKLINQFILDVETIFPGLFTSPELHNIIIENLKGDIVFSNNLPQDVAGTCQNGIITISTNFSSINTQKAIFHEFVHLITQNKINKDPKKLYSLAAIEMLTTLLEEIYQERILKIPVNKRVNCYIPYFARELYIVYGDDLPKMFLKDPCHIYTIATLPSYTRFIPDYQCHFFKVLLKECADAQRAIESNDQIEVINAINTVEKSITNAALLTSTEDYNHTLDIINRLYDKQYLPNNHSFYTFIKNSIECGKLNLKRLSFLPTLEQLYRVANSSLEEISELLQDEKLDNSAKLLPVIFGYSKYLDDGYIPDYDDFMAPSYSQEQDYVSYFNEREYFIKYYDLYQQLLEVLESKDISLVDVSNLSFRLPSNYLNQERFANRLLERNSLNDFYFNKALIEDEDKNVLFILDSNMFLRKQSKYTLLNKIAELNTDIDVVAELEEQLPDNIFVANCYLNDADTTEIYFMVTEDQVNYQEMYFDGQVISYTDNNLIASDKTHSIVSNRFKKAQEKKA